MDKLFRIKNQSGLTTIVLKQVAGLSVKFNVATPESGPVAHDVTVYAGAATIVTKMTAPEIDAFQAALQAALS